MGRPVPSGRCQEDGGNVHSAVAADFDLPTGFIHEKADAPPIGLFADRVRGARGTLPEPALVVLVVLRASRDECTAPAPMLLLDDSHRIPLLDPLSLPPPPPVVAVVAAWLLRRYSPLVRGAGAGS